MSNSKIDLEAWVDCGSNDHDNVNAHIRSRNDVICLVYGGRSNKKIVASRISAANDLYAALEKLTEWGRTYTSPTDKNSPHALLIEAVAALELANKE